MTKRRKYIIGIIVVIVVLWIISVWIQSKRKFQFSYQKPEFTTIERGDLEYPISATGLVAPASKVEIKCKASGTIKRVYFEAGDMVRAGDLLVELDPVDEQRNVDNAKGEVNRAKASLELADADAAKAQRDWPLQIQTALANLEATRVALQGTVVAFKKLDILRRSSKEEARIDVIDTTQVQPVPAESDKEFLKKLADRQIDLARREALAAGKLIEYGKGILPNEKEENLGQGVSFMEYQEALINLWQTAGRLMGAMSEVENAVNSGILVEQAKTRVVLAREALRIANFALDQTDQRLKETKVKAPRDGLIQEVFVREGQIISSGITSVTGGTPLMMLADVTKLYIEADVDEADIGRVRELAPADRSARLGFLDKVPGSIAGTPPPPATGDPEKMAMLRSSNKVDITVEASREETFTGKIDRVYPDPKIVNNIVTYKVNILLTGDNRSKLLTGEYRKKLMLGMHANVKFTSRKLTNVLKVVNEAIRVKNEEHGVYIEGPDKKPLFVPVKVGLTDGTMIELKTDKLKEKQQVYIKLPTSKDGEEGKVDDN